LLVISAPPTGALRHAVQSGWVPGFASGITEGTLWDGTVILLANPGCGSSVASKALRWDATPGQGDRLWRKHAVQRVK